MADVITNILLGTFVLGLLVFLTQYAFSDWHSSIVGRYFMYFMLTMFGTFGYIILARFFGPFPGRVFVNVGIMLLLNYSAWKMAWLIYTIRKGKRKEDD